MKKLGVILSLTTLSAVAVIGVPLSPTADTLSGPRHDMQVQVTDDRLADSVSVDYHWPSGSEVPVLRRFKVGRANWNAGHRGVDLALAAGNSVRAAADGVVVYSGKLNDRELVSIEHADGIRTTYEPIIPMVKRGARVSQGDVIGEVEGTHCAPFSCLHWGAKRNSADYLDPLSLLRAAPIRLYE